MLLYIVLYVRAQTPDSLGCLLEMSWNGTRPLTLVDSKSGNQVTRTFLEDGDEVIYNGWAEGFADGQPFRVGFGTAVGTVLPAFDPLNPTPPSPATPVHTHAPLVSQPSTGGIEMRPASGGGSDVFTN